MTTLTHESPEAGLFARLSAALANFMTAATEACRPQDDLRRILDQTDEELAARGMSRVGLSDQLMLGKTRF